MKSYIVLILALFIIIPEFGFCAETSSNSNSGAVIVQATKFYVIPIDNSTLLKQDSFQLVVFRSIYNFMRFIPSLDVPDDKLMNDLFWVSPMLSRWEKVNPSLAPKAIFEADYILYGDYTVKEKDPGKASITMRVWSKKDNKNVFTKTYITSTDIEIFDTIDTILKDVIEGTLRINYSVAKINFDVKAGKERYDIFINGKPIDSADKKDYKKALNVLGRQKYEVSIVRTRDGKTVYKDSKFLDTGEKFQISYVATGSALVDGIVHGVRGKEYHYSIDGTPSFPGQVYTNMNALTQHSILVLDAKSNTVYSSDFSVLDGAETHVTPEEKWAGPFHFDIFTGIPSSFIGAGFAYYPDRYFWLEVSCGGGGMYSPMTAGFVYAVAPGISACYYINGDLSEELRWGVGVNGTYYQYIAPGLPSTPAFGYSAGAFALLEWQWLFIRAGAGYEFDDSTFFPAVSIGIKF